MAVITRTVESIGATGRDFATVALWEAALPADLTTGDGEMRVGEMFADANITEIGTLIAGQTTSENTPIILRAASGESPIWRPTSGSATVCLQTNTSDVYIDGIEFAGDGGATITAALFLGNQLSLRGHILRCIFRDSPSIGLGFNAGSSFSALYILAYDNSSHGIRNNGNAAVFVSNCGVFSNGGDGFSARRVLEMALRNSWSLDNTGKDVFQVKDDAFTGWNFISDTSFTDESIVNMKNNSESQASGSMGFANLGGRDFRLNVGSVLRAKGTTFAVHETTIAVGVASHERWLDLDRLPLLNVKSSDLVDVGPFQSSYV